MATYTTIPDTEIDQDSPVTQPLMTALRDNPLAIAEGTAGAPKVLGSGLDVVIGAYSLEAADATLTGLDRVRWLAGDFTVETTTAVVRNFQVRTSTDNGASWGSYTTLFSIGGSSGYAGKFYFDLQTGAFWSRGRNTDVIGTVTVPANVNAAEFRTSATNGLTYLRLFMVSLGGRA